MSHYDKIAAAIEYIQSNVHQQPSLEDIASHVSLSPYHFQRVFSQWAGVTPKRLLQVLTLTRAKQLLDNQKGSIFDVSDQLGLSSASRLYDHFVTLEAITPSEYTKQGEGLSIQYSYFLSPFGRAFMAVTERGICKLVFTEPHTPGQPLTEIKSEWPDASFVENHKLIEDMAKKLFSPENSQRTPISLYVRGTNFQVNVWRALLQIQPGHLVSYGALASAIGKPNASRAVGSAIGANPVALMIPCHRVLRQNGELGGYRWGRIRKQAILAREAALLGNL